MIFLAQSHILLAHWSIWLPSTSVETPSRAHCQRRLDDCNNSTRSTCTTIFSRARCQTRLRDSPRSRIFRFTETRFAVRCPASCSTAWLASRRSWPTTIRLTAIYLHNFNFIPICARLILHSTAFSARSSRCRETSSTVPCKCHRIPIVLYGTLTPTP